MYTLAYYQCIAFFILFLIFLLAKGLQTKCKVLTNKQTINKIIHRLKTAGNILYILESLFTEIQNKKWETIECKNKKKRKRIALNVVKLPTFAFFFNLLINVMMYCFFLFYCWMSLTQVDPRLFNFLNRWLYFFLLLQQCAKLLVESKKINK